MDNPITAIATLWMLTEEDVIKCWQAFHHTTLERELVERYEAVVYCAKLTTICGGCPWLIAIALASELRMTKQSVPRIVTNMNTLSNSGGLSISQQTVLLGLKYGIKVMGYE